MARSKRPRADEPLMAPQSASGDGPSQHDHESQRDAERKPDDAGAADAAEAPAQL